MGGGRGPNTDAAAVAAAVEAAPAVSGVRRGKQRLQARPLPWRICGPLGLYKFETHAYTSLHELQICMAASRGRRPGTSSEGSSSACRPLFLVRPASLRCLGSPQSFQRALACIQHPTTRTIHTCLACTPPPGDACSLHPSLQPCKSVFLHACRCARLSSPPWRSCWRLARCPLLPCWRRLEMPHSISRCFGTSRGVKTSFSHAATGHCM